MRPKGHRSFALRHSTANGSGRQCLLFRVSQELLRSSDALIPPLGFRSLAPCWSIFACCASQQNTILCNLTSHGDRRTADRISAGQAGRLLGGKFGLKPVTGRWPFSARLQGNCLRHPAAITESAPWRAFFLPSQSKWRMIMPKASQPRANGPPSRLRRPPNLRPTRALPPQGSPNMGKIRGTVMLPRAWTFLSPPKQFREMNLGVIRPCKKFTTGPLVTMRVILGRFSLTLPTIRAVPE